MAGHSKWHNIQARKNASDAKKGSLFTRLARNIILAAREMGGDLDTNFKLRLAVEKAKAVNMPKDSIERSVKKGTGELAGEIMEEVIYEGFGPGGSAIVIESITDNKNRTLTNLKTILSKNGGNLAGMNSVLWMFDKKGVVKINKENFKNLKDDELELLLIDAGADDILQEEDEDSKKYFQIITTAQNLKNFQENIKMKNINVSEINLEYIPKEFITVSDAVKSTLEKIFELLDNEEDVNNFYTNVKF